MYACAELVDQDGATIPMLGLLPARTRMQTRLAKLGYVETRAVRDCLIGPAGTTARGHEFHYSRVESWGRLDYASEMENGGGKLEPDGLISGNLYASYVHLHFGSNPEVAASMLRSGIG